MKTHYILPAILSLGVAVISTQAIATGLSYDPIEDYYSQNYGVGTLSVEAEVEAATPFYDPYAEYYNTYYDTDGFLSNSPEATSEITKESENEPTFVLQDYPSMADPSNYFKW